MQKSLVLSCCLSLVAVSVLFADPPPVLRFPFAAKQAKELQLQWSKTLKLEVAITNSIGMKLVLIPPGRFLMGPNGSKYQVRLAKPFYLGATEVTMGQYRQFKAGHRLGGAAPEFNGEDRPAAGVSWHEAQAFCRWLSDQRAEKSAGRVYALPPEAQWEWSARAGTATSRYFGDTAKDQEKYSWFNVTYTPTPKVERGGRGRQIVARLQPNAWGLYDMLGNVWEWCGDGQSDPATGESRDPVMRGGSWRSGAFHCTAVAQDPGEPHSRGDHIGFRVVCRIDKAP